MRITLRISDPIGPFEENYLVYSNDPGNPTITLTLAGDVKPLPEWTKRIGTLDLQRGESVGEFKVWPTARPSITIDRGERFNFSIRVRPGSGESGELRLSSTATDHLSCKLRREANGPGYWLDFTVGPIDEPGAKSMNVVLETADGRPAIRIAVAANVLAENLIATPASLQVAALRMADLGRSSVTIARVGIRKLVGRFRIMAISSTLPFVRAEQQTIIDGTNYLIRLSIDPEKSPSPGSYDGLLRVETDDAQRPRIEVPVRITIVR